MAHFHKTKVFAGFGRLDQDNIGVLTMIMAA
jgi:hypothetical protein